MAEEQKMRNIGIEVKAPEKGCDDRNCPFHGSQSLRGSSFVGEVIKDKMQKSVVVEWETRKYIPKYERYAKRRTRIKAHNPPCINAVVGDRVLIKETRPISKTVHFVVIEKYGKEE